MFLEFFFIRNNGVTELYTCIILKLIIVNPESLLSNVFKMSSKHDILKCSLLSMKIILSIALKQSKSQF